MNGLWANYFTFAEPKSRLNQLVEEAIRNKPTECSDALPVSSSSQYEGMGSTILQKPSSITGLVIMTFGSLCCSIMCR